MSIRILRNRELIVKKNKFMVSEDYADDGTINTWTHQWDKRKKKWDWVSCSTKPYEEVVQGLMS